MAAKSMDRKFIGQAAKLMQSSKSTLRSNRRDRQLPSFSCPNEGSEL